MNNNFVLYLHIAPNGKKYFGITCQSPKRRWRDGKGYKNNKHFWNAIQKYNWNNIKHIILADNLTKEEACFFEQVMITLYNTANRQYGYNFSMGGEGGNSGCERTDEWNQNISKALKGKKRTEEFSQLMKEIAKKGAKNPSSKAVICLTTKQIFGSIREAERETNIGHSDIARCCTGKRNVKSAGKLPDGTKLVWRHLNHRHDNIYHVAGGYLVDNEKMARLIEESFGQTLSDEEIALLIEDIFGTDESIDYDNLPDII